MYILEAFAIESLSNNKFLLSLKNLFISFFFSFFKYSSSNFLSFEIIFSSESNSIFSMKVYKSIISFTMSNFNNDI